MNKLLAIKITHTLIWIFMVAVIFYVLHSGIFNEINMLNWFCIAINMLTWFCIAIIILEGIVLMAFKMSSPLTILALKYSNSTKDNFDIYLPNWMARHNKQIFTSVFVIGLITVLIRII